MGSQLYHGTMGWDGQEGPSMYPRHVRWEVPGTGGMSHGIPRQYGTMGRPEVPVDILLEKLDNYGILISCWRLHD